MAAVVLAEGDVERAFARERELWEAYKANDRARLEELVDPLALDVGPWGVLTRDEAIEAVARMRIEEYEIEDLRVRCLGPVEIVVYRARIAGTYNGCPFAATEIIVGSSWIAEGSQWRLGYRHESPRRETARESKLQSS